MKQKTEIAKQDSNFVIVKIAGTEIALTHNENHICSAIRKYNQLRRFPLSDIEIIEWKNTLIGLWPDLDPESVIFVVNKMIIHEIDCDGGGIQNITKGLKRLDVDEGGKYFVKPDHTY